VSTDAVTPAGLTVEDLASITSDITNGLQAAYGVTINTDQNSPDGQMIGIFSQAAVDLRELLVDVYNSFDPDAAYGTLLDARVALNGVVRNMGTFTQARVAVTATTSVTLPGLDVLIANPGATVFTVSDGSGNQYQLISSYSFGGPATQTLVFQAANIGQVVTQPNTITVVVTPIVGISSVNNPSTASDVIGLNEETDAQLKVRRAKMFYLSADGSSASIAAAIMAVTGVIDAYVYENNTGSAIGVIPAHGVYIVVRGGAAASIGQAIYSKKNAGSAMAGAVTYTVSRPNSQTITVSWDSAVEQDFYARFGITPVTGSAPSNLVVEEDLAAQLAGFYRINQTATIGDVVAAMLKLFPNIYITAVAVSPDNSSWGDTVAPTALKNYLVLPQANITIL
jgi:hypothetical protein